MTFNDLKLYNNIQQALEEEGYTNPTPIQEQAIPEILLGQDLVACAQTGTGKTGAFAIPILNLIHRIVGSAKKAKHIRTLVVTPTRELAIQIEQQIQGLSYFIPAGSKAVYGGGGGKEWEYEKQALVEGTDILVATPGKLLAHIKLGYVDFSSVKHLILDEADRMLDMGFQEDLQQIFKALPEKKQNLFFSATMATSIRNLAKKMLHEPIEINLSLSKPAEGVSQSVYLVYENQKNPLLDILLQERKHYERIILFTSTKNKVNEICFFCLKSFQ